MDMVSGIGAYAAEQAKARTGEKMVVSVLKNQNEQTKADGEAAVKLIESAGDVARSGNAHGVGGRLDVTG